MEVNGTKVPIDLQNIFLCVQQKKETHTGLQQPDKRIIQFWCHPKLASKMLQTLALQTIFFTVDYRKLFVVMFKKLKKSSSPSQEPHPTCSALHSS